MAPFRHNSREVRRVLYVFNSVVNTRPNFDLDFGDLGDLTV